MLRTASICSHYNYMLYICRWVNYVLCIWQCCKANQFTKRAWPVLLISYRHYYILNTPLHILRGSKLLQCICVFPSTDVVSPMLVTFWCICYPSMCSLDPNKESNSRFQRSQTYSNVTKSCFLLWKEYRLTHNMKQHIYCVRLFHDVYPLLQFVVWKLGDHASARKRKLHYRNKGEKGACRTCPTICIQMTHERPRKLRQSYLSASGSGSRLENKNSDFSSL